MRERFPVLERYNNFLVAKSILRLRGAEYVRQPGVVDSTSELFSSDVNAIVTDGTIYRYGQMKESASEKIGKMKGANILPMFCVLAACITLVSSGVVGFRNFSEEDWPSGTLANGLLVIGNIFVGFLYETHMSLIAKEISAIEKQGEDILSLTAAP